MTTINCQTLSGEIKPIPIDKISFRPAAYAILLQHGKILLTKMKATGKYHLPGGGIEIGETIEATLHREVYEETGIPIQVGGLVDFEELFFYYDPSGKAYHGLHFYYLCTPLASEVTASGDVAGSSSVEPCWMSVKDLAAGDFQHGGEKVLAVCRQELESSPAKEDKS